MASGDVKYLQSYDPAALPLMLDLYLDVERRSWKSQVQGTIGRDPRRVAFFRGMFEPDQPMQLGIGLLIRDGVPIAGCITSGYEKKLYGLQVVYDDQFARFSPGSVLFAMMMKDAIDRGWECLNLMSGFSYYKTHWLAETVECQTAQVFRVGSPLFYRAILGELRRTLRERLLPPAEQAEGNVLRRQVEAEAGDDQAPVEVDRRFLEPRLAMLSTLEVRAYTPADLDVAFGLTAKNQKGDPARKAS